MTYSFPRVFTVLAFGFLAACGPVPVDVQESLDASVAGETLHKLFEDEWRHDLSIHPLSATYKGINDFDHIMPSATPEFYAKKSVQDKLFLNRLEAIDPANLSDEDKLNYDLFSFVLNNRLEVAKYRDYRIPMVSDYGFYNGFMRIHESMPFKTTEDYDRYISRLMDVPRYFDENIANMETGIVEGFTMPVAILDKVAPNITALIVDDPENTSLFDPFKNLPSNFSDDERIRILGAGRAAIMEGVMPAMQKFSDFFTTTYMPNARQTLGIRDVPDGEEYYKFLVGYYTTLDVTPQQVHEVGLAEMARIKAAMEEIITEVGFEGSFGEFLEFMRTDEQFYAKSPEELLKQASWIAKRIDGILPGYFGKMPRMPYGVRAVPDDMAPNYTTGRYWGATKGGLYGGFFMVNTYALDKRPLYNLPALALHEGVPGHHLQISLGEELENVPEFRLDLYPHAFGEGWGLYAEKLGEEMGIYQTPYERFGRLTYEMWRAGRLVVDTGMHFMGWTRDEAVNLFIENSALSTHNINTEVDRYIAWPGQALAYKMGELTIIRLRERAENVLGEKFDIRSFHDAVLANGGIPLGVLEDQINNYIEREKQK
jgi:uncharacterized protein (DUF885 family)